MSTRFRKKEFVPFVINSKDRLNPSTEPLGNFTYSINTTVSRITELVLSSVQIPYTFYVINDNTNTLTLNAGANVVTLPNGNYTISNIITELITQIDAVIGGNTTVTYNNSTMKFTIGNDSAFIVDSEEDQATSTLSTLIGFRVSSASSTSNTADSVANISGPNYIYIKSDFLTKNIHNKVTYIDNSYQDALAIIPVDVNAGSIIITEPNIPLRIGTKITIEPTDIIDICLVDEANNILDPNGVDWSFQLILTTE